MSPLFACDELLEQVLNVDNRLVLAGKDSTVTVVEDDLVRTINICSEIIPILDPTKIDEVQACIDSCYQCNMATLLYLSAGAGRGVEISRIGTHPEFSEYFQEFFNHLRFGMRSEKGINHGVDNNSAVAHFVPPSLSRFIVVCNLCLYPAVVQQGETFKMPTLEFAPAAANTMFRQVMNLDSTTDNQDNKMKLNRELMIQINHVIAPKPEGRTSTIDSMTSLYHHTSRVHAERYAGAMYQRGPGGELQPSPLLVAHILHNALGEPSAAATTSRQQVNSIKPETFDTAIGRVLRNSSAKCKPHQKEVCKLIDNSSSRSHVFYRVYPGGGKSMAIILPLLGRALEGARIPRTIAVEPHNALLSQQKQDCERAFEGTNLRVWTLSSRDIELGLGTLNDDWDVLYISIHSFKILVSEYRDELKGWNVKNLIIDEIHLLMGEMFRHNQSWSVLHNLAALEMKMVLMSGTMNNIMIKMTAHYLGIGSNYEVVGSTNEYLPPNVSIIIRRTAASRLLTSLINTVNRRIQHDGAVVNVITLRKSDAVFVAEQLGSNCTWLTSQCTYTQRNNIVRSYSM